MDRLLVSWKVVSMVSLTKLDMLSGTGYGWRELSRLLKIPLKPEILEAKALIQNP